MVHGMSEGVEQGWQYLRAGDVARAEAYCRHLLQANFGDADAWYLLGLACQRQGRSAEAAECYRQVIDRDPHNADAYNNLGAAQMNAGDLDEAARCFENAVRLRPDAPAVHYNLGVALASQRKLEQSIASYRRALELQPDYVDAANNLGIVLTSYGDLDEATACFQRVLAAQPGHANALTNLGNALQEQGMLREAARAFRAALEARPDFAGAHSNLLNCLNYDPTVDADALFAEHLRWASVHARVAEASHANDRDPDRRLRVGYVSPDFYHHAVAHFLEPIFAHHDPGQVEIYCYAEVAAGDAVTRRFQGRAHGWRSTVGLSDAAVAEQVRADRIDILVDLAGHTARNRLLVFASKPAPVQISYLGYPNTTGLTTIDYRLTDAVADPPGDPVRHTEELVRLPRAFCYSPDDRAPEVSPLPAARAGGVTFGSLHNLAKLNEQVLDLWCRVLQAVPGARLLVLRHTLRGNARESLHRQLTERGLDPDRFELRHTSDGPGHLKAYERVDVALDAFPWSGHTTACEALWLGVPVVTLYGNRYAGRMAASTLTAVGLPEWIAQTPDEYVAIATRCASDIDQLGRLRASLRERMRSLPLCDGARFTRDLEETYRTLWRRWCCSPSTH
jgi:predicted O-linked N-acetylglucosamine transferase (SPINDLY family)